MVIIIDYNNSVKRTSELGSQRASLPHTLPVLSSCPSRLYTLRATFFRAGKVGTQQSQHSLSRFPPYHLHGSEPDPLIAS